MTKSSNSKVAIVTGGGSGLGYAIARKFTQEGIQTILIGRNESKLEKAKKEFGKDCHWKSFDLNQLENIPALVQEISSEFGKIDILVNNAGVHLKKPITEVTDEEFQNVIQTNLLSVFSLSREVSREMLKQGSGTIINISSMAAKYGIPKIIAYTAAKSAIEGLTRGMAVELSSEGIRVNCIAPGFIKTDMSSKAFDNDPERKNRVLSRTPMRKLGLPEDIGETAYFLASEASKFITGEVIVVDGGNSIGF